LSDAGYEVRSSTPAPAPSEPSLISNIFGADEDRTATGNEMDEIEIFIYTTKVKEPANTDPLVWWRMNAAKFPAVARLAKDSFAAQASSVASESAFSIAGRIVDANRSSLADESIQALMLLQSWTRFLRKNGIN